jgi:V-type H+-transporting ATPase subunit H
MFLECIEKKISNEKIDEDEFSGKEIFDLKDLNSQRHFLLKNKGSLKEEQLLELLKSKDVYLRTKACGLLTEIYATKKHRKEYLVFFRFYLREAQSYDEMNQLYNFLSRFLSCRSTSDFDEKQRKLEVCQDTVIMGLMVDYCHFKEVQYQILLVVYVLSFDKENIGHLVVFLERITSILEEKPREKIMRICYKIIVNILKSNHNLSIGLVSSLKHITTNLKDLNLNDEDLKENLIESYSLLSAKQSKYNIHSYLKDLFNGTLEEGEFHYDPLFWSTSLPVLQKNKIEIIKVLKKYLKSHKSIWISLACNDIYMLVKTDPSINAILNKYKVRDILFELTRCEDDDVRFRAVQALYLCIFSEWT